MTQFIFRNNFNIATKLFYAIVLAIYCVSRVLGIACFSYNYKRQCVGASWQTRLYSGCLFIIVGTFMPFALHILYTKMTFLRQNLLLSYVGYIRYGMLLMCALATLYMQMYNRCAIMDCINKMLKSRHIWQTNVNRNVSSHKQYVIGKIMAKAFTIMLQLNWVIFLIINDEASKSFWYLFTLLYVEYCHLIVVTTLNLLFYGCWIIALITEELNRNLLNHLRHLKDLTYHRMGGHHKYRCQYLVQQLEQMMQQHWETYKLSRSFMRLYSWQIVFFLTFAIIECVTQIFVMYFVAKDILLGKYELRNGRTSIVNKTLTTEELEEMIGQHERPKFHMIINPYALMYVAGIMWDMFLILLMINEMRVNFTKTRSIFSSTLWLKALLSPANQTVDKCLSHFNLYLVYLQPCLSYNACGLFTFDKHLILRLLESIFLYLLFVIQFDLIIN